MGARILRLMTLSANQAPTSCFIPVIVDADGTTSGPGFGQGIRPHVGVDHRTLADFLNAFLESGLVLVAVDEPGDEDYPIC